MRATLLGISSGLPFPIFISVLVGSLGNKFSNPALESRTFQQHTVLALEASYADVSAHPYHLPLVTAAGVLFLEADHISQPDLHNHARYLKELR
jgi:hypothetical protein